MFKVNKGNNQARDWVLQGIRRLILWTGKGAAMLNNAGKIWGNHL